METENRQGTGNKRPEKEKQMPHTHTRVQCAGTTDPSLPLARTQAHRPAYSPHNGPALARQGQATPSPSQTALCPDCDRPIETAPSTGQRPATARDSGRGDLRPVEASSGQQMGTGRRQARPETGRSAARSRHGGNRIVASGAIPAENRSKISSTPYCDLTVTGDGEPAE